jgi:hypothetical protein
MGPHNSDARQPHDTSQWPPAIIVDLSYAAAAVKAWSPNLFIDYVRDQSRDAYYGKSGDQYDSNSMDGSGPSSVNVRDETPVQSGSGHYNLRSRNKPSTIPPKGRHIADMMDVVSALWMQTSRVNKIKLEDAQPEASSLTRNEGVKAWLQSLEGSTTI